MEFEGAFFENSQYEILINENRIGSGTFGEVYKAKRIEDGSICAAKILKSEKGFDGNDQMKIMRESMILLKLHHPAILKFLGVNFQSILEENKLEPTIMTEYLPNKSLKVNLVQERNHRQNPNWTLTKKYISLIGISDAMRYLHEHGIIHRDLKPQNILIDKDFYPCVCDFGLARCFPEAVTNSMNLMMSSGVGTPLYMAPELIEYADYYGPSVDVYAFGMIAYEIVTGKEPFSELPKLNWYTISENVLRGNRPKFPANISGGVKDIIERCWSHNVKKRPSFKEIFEFLSSDLSYIKDDEVDKNEIGRYIEALKQERQKEEEEASPKKKRRRIKQEVLDDDDEEEEIDDDDDDEKIAILKDKRRISYRLYDASRNAEIIESPDASGDITIPKYIRFGSTKCNITTICDKAFSNSSIETLSFSPKSLLNHIGNSVFKNSQIRKICLPKSVTQIDHLWIQDADQLNEVVVDPANIYFSNNNGFLIRNDGAEILFASHDFKGDFLVQKGTTRIGDFSFSNIKGIQSLKSTVSTLKELGSHSFYQCENLKSVFIQQNESLSILSSCFSNCTNLSAVEISCKSFKSFNSIFFNCELLTSFKLATSEVVVLHPDTFKGCPNLNNISFHKSSKIEIVINDKFIEFCWPINLKSISFIKVQKITLGPQLFKNNKSIENILIQDSSELNIDSECFCFSSELKNVEIISNKINIINNFLSNCLKLSEVSILCNSDVSFPINSFKKCNKLKYISFKSQSKLIMPKYFLSDSKNLENVILKGKTKVRLGDSCFNNCKELKNVEIVESGAIRFGENEFVNCVNLKRFSIESDLNSQVEFAQNCFGACNGICEFNLNKGNITISNNCFKSSLLLTNLFLLKANNIVINDDQFAKSNSLKNITLESETDIKIGVNCFSKSEKLEVFHASAKESIYVSEKAFYKCCNLSNPTFKATSILSLSKKCFSGSNIETIELNGQKVEIDDNCFYNCKKLKNLIFGKIENLTLCSNLFDFCDKLESIQIEVLKELEIGSQCFVGSNVKNVFIQASSVVIEDDAFKNNASINSIRISSIIIKLKDNVFENCLNLHEIELNASSELNIGKSCFSGAQNLSSFELNGNLIKIGNLGFYNCNKLNTLNFQNSDQITFNDDVFVGCNNITLITINTKTHFIAGINCFNSLNKLHTVQISSRDVSLGNSCFAKCNNLETFSILNSEESKFGEKAFNDCTKLQTVCIISSQIAFNDYCFLGCSLVAQIDCTTASQITCFDTSFNNKNCEKFIKCNSKTNIVVESKSSAKDDTLIYKLLNKFRNKE